MSGLKLVLKTMYIHQLRWNVLFFIMLIIIMFLAGGCALKHEVEGESTVNHVIQIDVRSVYDFYTETCSEKYATQEDIDECIDNSATDFINLLNQITEGLTDEINN